MDLLSSCPFWPIRDGLPAQFARLDENQSCDVAVIGAGVSGALVAWHLVQAGLETVVLDRREAAHGSTAGNTGLLVYELDTSLEKLTRIYGEEFARRVYRRCARAIDAIERIVRREKIGCGFARRNSVQLAARADHVPRLRREFAARAAAGLDVEWWGRARVRRESSLPHPAALRSSAGAEIDAYRLTYGLLQAAQGKGGRVYDRTGVEKIESHARGLTLTTSGGSRIRARQVVIAAGYESARFLPRNVTALHSTFALVTEPVATFEGWPADRAVLWDTGDPYLYLRATADNRVLIGGYDEMYRDPLRRDRALPRKAVALQSRLRRFFPALDVRVDYAWAGTFADTPHGLPVIGVHPTKPRHHFALGYGGNGLVFSLIAAEIIRDTITGGRDPDAELFGFDRVRP